MQPPTKDIARCWRRLSRKSRRIALTFLVRLLVNAVGLWVATRIVPGVTYTGGWMPILGVALVFGVVNAFIRPVAKILTFPIVILTLGLFLLVINGFMLWLTSALSDALDLGSTSRGSGRRSLGALVVSLVSGLLSLVTAEKHVSYRSIR